LSGGEIKIPLALKRERGWGEGLWLHQPNLKKTSISDIIILKEKTKW